MPDGSTSPRLHRSDLTGPGYHRRRRGRGFSYTGTDGKPLRDSRERARIKALVIPPAWQDVWICPDGQGHVQAVGTDSAGRRQYVYHERWRVLRDEAKHHRMLEFGAVLPKVRRAVDEHLTSRGLF